MDKETLNEALKYASGSNRIEENSLTKEEVSLIMDSIVNGKDDGSLLYYIVKKVMDDQKKEEITDGKNR